MFEKETVLLRETLFFGLEVVVTDCIEPCEMNNDYQSSYCRVLLQIAERFWSNVVG